MKILWLGWEDRYTTRHMRLAAESERTQLDAFEIFDYKGNQSMILEVNRRPAFEGNEQATGFDVAGEFLKSILCRAQK